MTFITYAMIGFIVLTINMITKIERYDEVWSCASSTLSGIIGFVIGLLVNAMIWPIILVNDIILPFLRND